VKATQRSKPIVLFVVHATSCRAHIGHLTANGFHVCTTAPPSAIAHATALQPDVIVLDCDDMCDVTAQLKRHLPTHHIPIISLIEQAAASESMSVR
jgi:CheY-like chemotaxis protein